MSRAAKAAVPKTIDHDDDRRLFDDPDRPAAPPRPAVNQGAVAVRSPRTRAAVAAAQLASQAPTTVDAVRMLEIIAELAKNPAVDAEKFERLVGMQERMVDRQARMAFDAAMIVMQPKLPVITKDGRIIIEARDRGDRQTKAQNTQYAKWETLMPLIKPILFRHGFALTHRSSTAPDGRLRITAVLKGHGHTDDTCYFDLMADVGGSKSNAQSWASSLGYGKRHTACAVLNIVTKDDDNDGKGPPVVVGDPLDQDDVEQLRAYCIAANLKEEKLIAEMNRLRKRGQPEAKDLATIPRARFEEAAKLIQSYAANAAAAQAKREAEQGGKK